MSLEPWPSATSIPRPLAQRTSAPERCASPNPLAESRPPRWWPIAVWSIPKRSSSPSVWAKSRAVTSTSSPRARRTSITGRMTRTCGEFVRSIQTRKDGAGYFGQVFRRVCVRADMRKPLIAGLAIAASLLGASTAAAQTWAPASSATVHPGVMTYTAGAQCTANFIYTDAAGAVYIGQAAHCSGTGGQTDTDGCQTQSLPNGTPIEVTGASRPGTLVYNSWTAMQSAGETDPDTCSYNDIGLIRLDPADYDKVNPSVPTLGGPTALGETTAALDDVYTYGNSSLRQGITLLSPKLGKSLGASGGGWTHLVYTVSPGIPGDSGSGFMDAQGRAFGVLSTLQLAPVAASNGVSDLRKMLAYMRTQGGPDVALAAGTEPFTGSIIG